MNPTTKYAVINGSRRRYQVAEMLHAAGLLAGTFIDGCGSVGWSRLLSALPARLLPAPVRRFVERRPALPPEKVWSHAGIGVKYALKLRRAKTYTDIIRAQAWFNQEFNQWVVQHDWGETGGVFVFDGATTELIAKAKRLGVRYIHEQSIAAGEVVQQLVEAESTAYPGWESPESLPKELFDYCRRAYTQSWAAADLIVCASDFVVNSIRAAGGPAEKCVVVPYGAASAYHIPGRRPHTGPLRVLTVGTVSLRKGSQYVLAVARRLAGLAEFRMVGTIGVSPAATAELRSAVDLTGPVRGADVINHLGWADVFLLPSVCEGSAVAVYEAMTAGLPVITTPNAGSIIRDGIDGLIVPIRDVDAIIDRLTALVNDPARRAELSAAAIARAAEFTSEVYARRLIDQLVGVVKS